MDEASFIDALKALATHPGARGLTDDAAILQVGDGSLVFTHDMIVEGVHFLPDQDPADIAWKLVVANLSGLAAKGATPLGVLLGHMLGRHDERFLDGLAQVLDEYDVSLMGGDTVTGGSPRALGLTAIGRATHIPVPSRGGAQMGDRLFVTGKLGAAMLGLEALREGTGDDSSPFRRPVPRMAEGIALAPQVTAMMDISDGLLLDAWRIAEASQVSLAIESRAVPCAVPENRRLDAMTWGEDFELLFTLPPGIDPAAPATCIGIVEMRGYAPLFLDGEPVVNPEGLGYRHG